MKVQNEIQTREKSIFEGNVNLEKLFELAIETANQGYKLKAMNIARECISFAKQTNDYTLVYIHGFLAVLSIDIKKYSSARIHLYHALNRLEKTHFDYKLDFGYLTALQNKIEQLEGNEAVSVKAA